MDSIKDLVKRKGIIMKRLSEIPTNMPKYKKLSRELILIKLNLGELQFKRSPTTNINDKIQ